MYCNDDNNKKEEDENELLNNLVNSYKNSYEKKDDKSNTYDYHPPVYNTDSNINRNIKRKRFSESGKSISQNIKANLSKKDNKRAQSSKFKTYVLKSPIELRKRNNINIIKSNIFGIKENDKESISSNSIKDLILKNNNNKKDIDKLNESSLIIKDIINLEQIKRIIL